jgi:hypothetical protein
VDGCLWERGVNVDKVKGCIFATIEYEGTIRSLRTNAGAEVDRAHLIGMKCWLKIDTGGRVRDVLLSRTHKRYSWKRTPCFVRGMHLRQKGEVGISFID